MDDLYRFSMILSDGRKVYMARFGMIVYFDAAFADWIKRMSEDVIRSADPAVFTLDLKEFRWRSSFAEGEQYVAPLMMRVESIDDPTDPDAYLTGGGRAVDAGFLIAL